MHNEGMSEQKIPGATELTGEQLRAIREGMKETQEEFGAHFGVDQSTVHRWETKGITDRGTTAVAIERILTDISPRAPETESAA